MGNRREMNENIVGESEDNESKKPGGYFGVKRIGMTVGNPKKLP